MGQVGEAWQWREVPPESVGMDPRGVRAMVAWVAAGRGPCRGRAGGAAPRRGRAQPLLRPRRPGDARAGHAGHPVPHLLGEQAVHNLLAYLLAGGKGTITPRRVPLHTSGLPAAA